jgi:dTDP-4-amino-4,6-dideoxygalactose transaminase
MIDVKIPFMDLRKHHSERDFEYIEVFKKILHSAQFINGKSVEDFESSFAAYCGTKFAVGVGSGTDALRFSLIASGIKQNDIVITVPNTFIATTESITQSGAEFDFVDVSPETMCMSPDKYIEYLEKKCFVDKETGESKNKISGKVVKAVIPVHLYGQMADMDEISAISEMYKISVIEDACQAHGAQYYSKIENKRKKAGGIGKAAGFSFYPGKNLGACGDAGAVTTNEENIYKQVKMIRDHGQVKKYYHDIEGYNGRLDAVQAAILTVKLQSLDQWNNRRITIAKHYDQELMSVKEIVIPVVPQWSSPVYHLYVIRVNNRDNLKSHLQENGIETALHYPIPLHLQKAYERLGYSKGSFPVSEKCADTILSLPLHPWLNDDDIQYIIEKIKEFYKKKNGST